MDRTWNPDIPTRREDVEAILRDVGIDPNALIESFLQDTLCRYDGDPRLKPVLEPDKTQNQSNHLYYILVDKDKAIDLRARIKPFASKHRLFPMIRRDIREGAMGCPDFDLNPAANLAASEELEASDQAAEWLDFELSPHGPERRVRRVTITDIATDWDLTAAHWPTNIPFRTTPYLRDKYVPVDDNNTAILFLPGRDPIDALAHLSFGGNQPATALIIAYVRQWDRRYGVDLINTTCDSIEIRIDRPPQSQEDALRLARECFLLCPDLRGQMEFLHGFKIDTLYDLAAHLMGSEYLIFWWD